MNFGYKVLCMLLLSAIVLTACGAETATPNDVNVVLTQGVGTMVAAFFQTQTAMVTPATNTATMTQTPYPTPTSFPSLVPVASATSTLFYWTSTAGTPTPTGTFYTSTPKPASLAYGCNNLAFIRDVTIPAGTVVQRGQDFRKTWKVQNTGTCNWMYQYALQPLGDSMGTGPTKIQKLVTPWDWSELSVELTAPQTPGTYKSYWRLADAEGNMFGATLVVSIKVAAPSTDTPVPTATTAPPPTGTTTATPTATP